MGRDDQGDVRRRWLPRWCSYFTDRHGKMRVRFRRAGFETHYFQTQVGTEAFMAEYRACLTGETAPPIQPGAERTRQGSMSALIVAYYRSPQFLGLKPSTKATYRGILDRFRSVHGDNLVAHLKHEHVVEILGKMEDTPAAANNLLDRLQMLMKTALKMGWRQTDPTIGVERYSIRGDGFHTWTEAEIAQFEARWPIGTKPRLAMGLLLYLGQRRSDVVRLGPQLVRGGRVSLRQQKTDAQLELPIHPKLREILAGTETGHLAYLVTEQGRPFTPAGFSNWFRQRCNEAALPHCSAHGLRKAAARRLAEAGCTANEIAAVTGHKSLREVERYTRAADQVRLADRAMARTSGELAPVVRGYPEKVSQNRNANPLKEKARK